MPSFEWLQTHTDDDLDTRLSSLSPITVDLPGFSTWFLAQFHFAPLSTVQNALRALKDQNKHVYQVLQTPKVSESSIDALRSAGQCLPTEVVVTLFEFFLNSTNLVIETKNCFVDDMTIKDAYDYTLLPRHAVAEAFYYIISGNLAQMQRENTLFYTSQTQYYNDMLAGLQGRADVDTNTFLRAKEALAATTTMLPSDSSSSSTTSPSTFASSSTAIPIALLYPTATPSTRPITVTGLPSSWSLPSGSQALASLLHLVLLHIHPHSPLYTAFADDVRDLSTSFEAYLRALCVCAHRTLAATMLRVAVFVLAVVSKTQKQALACGGAVWRTARAAAGVIVREAQSLEKNSDYSDVPEPTEPVEDTPEFPALVNTDNTTMNSRNSGTCDTDTMTFPENALLPLACHVLTISRPLLLHPAWLTRLLLPLAHVCLVFLPHNLYHVPIPLSQARAQPPTLAQLLNLQGPPLPKDTSKKIAPAVEAEDSLAPIERPEYGYWAAATGDHLMPVLGEGEERVQGGLETVARAVGADSTSPSTSVSNSTPSISTPAAVALALARTGSWAVAGGAHATFSVANVVAAPWLSGVGAAAAAQLLCLVVGAAGWTGRGEVDVGEAFDNAEGAGASTVVSTMFSQYAQEITRIQDFWSGELSRVGGIPNSTLENQAPEKNSSSEFPTPNFPLARVVFTSIRVLALHLSLPLLHQTRWIMRQDRAEPRMQALTPTLDAHARAVAQAVTVQQEEVRRVRRERARASALARGSSVYTRAHTRVLTPEADTHVEADRPNEDRGDVRDGDRGGVFAVPLGGGAARGRHQLTTLLARYTPQPLSHRVILFTSARTVTDTPTRNAPEPTLFVRDAAGKLLRRAGAATEGVVEVTAAGVGDVLAKRVMEVPSGIVNDITSVPTNASVAVADAKSAPVPVTTALPITYITSADAALQPLRFTRSEASADWRTEDYGELLELRVNKASTASSLDTLLAERTAHLSVHPHWHSHATAKWLLLQLVRYAADLLVGAALPAAGAPVVAHEEVLYGDVEPAGDGDQYGDGHNRGDGNGEHWRDNVNVGVVDRGAQHALDMGDEPSRSTNLSHAHLPTHSTASLTSAHTVAASVALLTPQLLSLLGDALPLHRLMGARAVTWLLQACTGAYKGPHVTVTLDKAAATLSSVSGLSPTATPHILLGAAAALAPYTTLRCANTHVWLEAARASSEGIRAPPNTVHGVGGVEDDGFDDVWQSPMLSHMADAGLIQLIASALKDALYVRTHTHTFHAVCAAIMACHRAAKAHAAPVIASAFPLASSSSSPHPSSSPLIGSALPHALRVLLENTSEKKTKKEKNPDASIPSTSSLLTSSSSLNSSTFTALSTPAPVTSLLPLSSSLVAIPPTASALAAFNTAATSAAAGETLDATLLAALAEQFRFICGSTDDRDMGEGEVCVQDDGALLGRLLGGAGTRRHARPTYASSHTHTHAPALAPSSCSSLLTTLPPSIHVCRCYRCAFVALHAAARREHRQTHPRDVMPTSFTSSSTSTASSTCSADTHVTADIPATTIPDGAPTVPPSVILCVINSPAMLFSEPATPLTAHLTDLLALAAGEDARAPSLAALAAFTEGVSVHSSPSSISTPTKGSATSSPSPGSSASAASATSSSSLLPALLPLKFLPTTHKVEVTRCYLSTLASLALSLSAGSAHHAFARVLPMLYDYIAHYDPVIRRATMVAAHSLLAGHAPRTHALVTDAFQRLVGAYMRTQEADFLTSLSAHVYGITGYFGRDLVLDLNAINAVGQGRDVGAGTGTAESVRLSSAVRRVLGLRKGRKARAAAQKGRVCDGDTVETHDDDNLDNIVFSDDDDEELSADNGDEWPLEGLTEEEIDVLLRDSELSDPLIELLKDMKHRPEKRDQSSLLYRTPFVLADLQQMRLLVANTLTALLQAATVKYNFSGPFSLSRARNSAVYSRHLPLLQCLCEEDWRVDVNTLTSLSHTASTHPDHNSCAVETHGSMAAPLNVHVGGSVSGAAEANMEDLFGPGMQEHYAFLRVKMMCYRSGKLVPLDSDCDSSIVSSDGNLSPHVSVERHHKFTVNHETEKMHSEGNSEEDRLVIVILDSRQSNARDVWINGSWMRVVGRVEPIKEVCELLRHVMVSIGMF